MNGLFTEQMLILFLILALGALVGSFNWRGISLGSAGVLFVALVFGHFSLSVPRAVMDLGLLLFVYSVGLQAGPRFFRTFRRQGIKFVVIGVAVALTGMLVAWGVGLWFELPDDLVSGLYAGALTCTPALAAAVDAFSRFSPTLQPAVSVGYGIAYPFSMLGMVLLIQFLPRILKRDVHAEERSWWDERGREAPALVVRQFQVKNSNVCGQTLRGLDTHRLAHVNITRIRREDRVFLARPDFVLQEGDVLLAVGPLSEMEKIRLLVGEEIEVPMDVNADIGTRDVEVTSPQMAGKTLSELRIWDHFGVVITRIRRQGMEITPLGGVALEFGDGLHVVGEKNDLQRFVEAVGGEPRHAQETSMLTYLIGLVLGIGVGLIPFRLPGGVEIKLGIAGGAFLVSLLMGHMGRLGRWHIYVPVAAKNLTRELGLMLFLAGAGTSAGAQLVSVIQERGWVVFLAGIIVTVASAGVGLFLMLKVYCLGTLVSLGALTACMTNPPGLAAANAQTSTDIATISYASVYPVALIFKIVFAQILVSLLLHF